mgnify:CR=1 FL=1
MAGRVAAAPQVRPPLLHRGGRLAAALLLPRPAAAAGRDAPLLRRLGRVAQGDAHRAGRHARRRVLAPRRLAAAGGVAAEALDESSGEAAERDVQPMPLRRLAKEIAVLEASAPTENVTYTTDTTAVGGNMCRDVWGGAAKARFLWPGGDGEVERLGGHAPVEHVEEDRDHAARLVLVVEAGVEQLVHEAAGGEREERERRV